MNLPRLLPFVLGGFMLALMVPASAWTGVDIGSVTPSGTDSLSGGVYTISGAGADIYGTTDACHYVYQAVSGDAELITRVATVQNVNAWSKAGVMIRQSNAAGDINAFIAVTPVMG